MTVISQPLIRGRPILAAADQLDVEGTGGRRDQQFAIGVIEPEALRGDDHDLPVMNRRNVRVRRPLGPFEVTTVLYGLSRSAGGEWTSRSISSCAAPKYIHRRGLTSAGVYLASGDVGAKRFPGG